MTKESDDIRHVSCANVPRIAMWRCDGEASHQLPHAHLESVGGGFLGRMQKNVGFADLVTYECENIILLDLLHIESVSILIDTILQRALRCRGEQVLVLVTDCCGSKTTTVRRGRSSSTWWTNFDGLKPSSSCTTCHNTGKVMPTSFHQAVCGVLSSSDDLKS